MFHLKLYHKLTHYLTQLLIITIQVIRPFFGIENVCPFTIGCTEYAVIQLQEESFFTACKRILQRLAMCNPITNIFKK